MPNEKHCSTLKRQFDTPEEAGVFLEYINTYGQEYEYYECPECGKIHIQPVKENKGN